MSIVIALIVFSLIIIIHELGHFLLAKRNGVTVTEFSVGMGPRILSTVKGETRYSLKLLPFGGSCMMVGEDEDNNEEGSFATKSVGARISIIAAGPIFNFLLAFLLAWIIISFNGVREPVIGGVMEDSPAEEAGLMEGDRITTLNGKKMRLYNDVSSYLSFHPSEEVAIGYERDGESYTVMVEPMLTDEGYLFGLYSSERVKGSPLKNIQYSAYEVRYWLDTTYNSLRMLVSGQVGADDVAGAVGIVNMIGDVYESSIESGVYYVFLNMMSFSIMLSVNLGVMNLLPIPALDGGRLVFLFVEAIRGKRISPEKEGMVHLAGLVMLLLLMVVVMFNDIRNIFM